MPKISTKVLTNSIAYAILKTQSGLKKVDLFKKNNQKVFLTPLIKI